MNDGGDFFKQVLNKLARRYQLKGRLQGTLQLGQSLDRQEMSKLHSFFGVSPIQVNAKNEVRLSCDKLLENGSENQWLERIGAALGHPLQQHNRMSKDEKIQKLLSRLKLAFPSLNKLIDFLGEEHASLKRMLSTKSEEAVNTCCFQTAAAVEFVLKNTIPITLAELAARFFNDSKALRQGELRALFLQWLRSVSIDNEMLEDNTDILASHHILTDRLTVDAVLFGPVIYEKNGKIFDWICELYSQGEAATIGWSNIANVDRMYFQESLDGPPGLICCENEAPFSRLMWQQHKQCLLFTSGFPNSTVQKTYSLLAPKAAACSHWGDSDPAGLRIAAIMNAIFPLQLYHCDLQTLQQHKPFLIPLTQKQHDICRHLLTTTANFPFADELIFTMENGWLEQENWRN